jgi:hypothetical protein
MSTRRPLSLLALLAAMVVVVVALLPLPVLRTAILKAVAGAGRPKQRTDQQMMMMRSAPSGSGGSTLLTISYKVGHTRRRPK